ncbi:MAG: DinB family protein [Chitinophagales bacterium]|nr:DinB family protein [Chitinophagales bacterium]
MANWKQPEEGTFIPYQKTYFDLVPAGDLVDLITNQFNDTETLLLRLSDDQAGHAYAPGKWTIKEVINHLVDCERIMCYRALCIARGEQTSLPGFEQDDYVTASGANERSMKDLVNEFRTVRQASISLLRTFDDAALSRLGTANHHTVSVNALCHVIAGHELHHMKIIRERYLL